MWSLLGKVGTKVYINGPVHMTKMAAMPIYVKNLQKSSSPEPVFCDPETWHVASSLKPLNWLIKAKFQMEPPWERGRKVYMNGPDHMTKMATTPIYGKYLLKYSFPEPEVL